MSWTHIQRPLDDRAHGAWFGLAFSVLLAVVLLNAWVCDDAYITFRTCFNLTHGYGPVYNVGERVQTFTNPLWMLLMSGLYIFTGEAFFTSIALSIVLLGGTIWMLGKRIFEQSWAVVAMLVVMASSRSFVEYATSGLENVLNGFLLVVFVALLMRSKHVGRKVLWMSLIASLGMVSRMDTALLYLPALAIEFWRQRSWTAVAQVALGMLPFLGWEIFSILYYGFPFPNTAYAKLNAGLSPGIYAQRGRIYWLISLKNDPITIAMIALGMIFSCARSMRKWLGIGLGIGLYSYYILRIGGDFMMGRFFYLPFLGSAMVVMAALEQRRLAPLWAMGLLAIGWCNPLGAAYNGAREAKPREELVDHGVADERGWYRDKSTLVALSDTLWALQMERNLDLNMDSGAQSSYLFWDYLGFMGYGAGPQVSLCDRFALADPLLARLPMVWRLGWRVGHYERAMPRGMRKTLRTGVNHIQDENLCTYYDHLSLITRGPIWSWERLQTIWAMNMGEYDALIDREFYSFPAPRKVDFATIQDPHPQGEKFNPHLQVVLWSDLPLRIELGEGVPFPHFEISLMSEADYLLVFWYGNQQLAELRLQQKWIGGGLAIYHVDTPREAIAHGFDAITIEGLGGNEYYSLGHLKPIYENPDDL